MRTAPACPPTPPPCAVTTTSIWSARFVNFTGSVASCFHAKFGKYCSTGRPFTVNLPEPGRTKTRAMDSLRRPVPWNQVLLNGVLLDASELKTPPRQTSKIQKFKKACPQTTWPSSAKKFLQTSRPADSLRRPAPDLRRKGQPTCGNC